MNYKFVFLLTLLFVGCGYYPMTSGYGVRPAFSLKSHEFGLNYPDSLRLEGVYINSYFEWGGENWSVEENQLETHYRFMRFFPNGQAFTVNRVLDESPTIREFNSLDQGLVGYYVYNQDSISVSFFIRSGLLGGGFISYTGTVQSDTLIINHWSGPLASGGFFYKHPEGNIIPPQKYIRINVNHLTGEPDW